MLATKSAVSASSAGVSWPDILRWPVRIVALGIAAAVALLTVALAWHLSFGAPESAPAAAQVAAASRASVRQMVIGGMVLVAGVCLVFFLWWLAARFFNLIATGRIQAASLADIKDLPMGLPEGTVRAVLALVVAVVGLPLLLFHDALDLEESIAGYMNGIIAGVFGFYFGTRTAGILEKAVNQIADARETAAKKEEEANAAKGEAATAARDARTSREETERIRSDSEQQLRLARDAKGFDADFANATRQLALADTVLKDFGEALSSGLVAPEAAQSLADARQALAGLQGVAAGNATSDQLRQLAKAVDTATGPASPLPALLRGAAPLLADAPAPPGLGPTARLATLLGIGARLGSSQYLRWRARMLGAPVGQGVIDFGTVTAERMHAALQAAQLAGSALVHCSQPQVETALADILAAPDGAARLVAACGTDAASGQDVLTRQQAEVALADLRQALLASYSANDIQQDTLRQVADALAGAIQPELASAAAQGALRSLTPAHANRLIDAAAGISARLHLPEAQHAAFDALIALVDAARYRNIDLAAALGALRQ